LLHVNLTVHDVDPTAEDPGAGESDPPEDAQHFPYAYAFVSLSLPLHGNHVKRPDQLLVLKKNLKPNLVPSAPTYSFVLHKKTILH
jgi:hypothetical protein